MLEVAGKAVPEDEVRSASTMELEGARMCQEEPGGARERARRSKEEPGEARGSQEEPGGAPFTKESVRPHKALYLYPSLITDRSGSVYVSRV